MTQTDWSLLLYFYDRRSCLMPTFGSKAASNCKMFALALSESWPWTNSRYWYRPNANDKFSSQKTSQTMSIRSGCEQQTTTTNNPRNRSVQWHVAEANVSIKANGKYIDFVCDSFCMMLTQMAKWNWIFKWAKRWTAALSTTHEVHTASDLARCTPRTPRVPNKAINIHILSLYWK